MRPALADRTEASSSLRSRGLAPIALRFTHARCLLQFGKQLKGASEVPAVNRSACLGNHRNNAAASGGSRDDNDGFVSRHAVERLARPWLRINGLELLQPLQLPLDRDLLVSAPFIDVSMGVRMAPGQRTLTRTPLVAASIRSDFERPTTACFTVDKAARPRTGSAPPGGGCVYNVSESLADHHRVSCMHPVHDAFEVDVDNRSPIGRSVPVGEPPTPAIRRC